MLLYVTYLENSIAHSKFDLGVSYYDQTWLSPTSFPYNIVLLILYEFEQNFSKFICKGRPSDNTLVVRNNLMYYVF